jgi:U3 small nucleolar ribonucleoprotein component
MTPRHSTSKADYDNDIVACSNLDMNLRAQLESICTNGVCTNKFIEKMVNIVLKLSDEIRIL